MAGDAMDLESAKAMAQAKLAALAKQWEIPLTLQVENAEERSWCWIFPFTADDQDAPLGPGPLVVNKDASEVWLSSSGPLEPQLQAYAKEHGYDETA